MGKIPDIWADVKAKSRGYVNPWTDEYEGDIPKAVKSLKSKEADDVASFAQGLFTDARLFWENEFERTKSYRFNVGKAGTYWDQNLMLESGLDWQVWGRRNENEKDQWKQELVDPVTGQNIRARVAYLTANWHDIQVSPNIQDINAVLSQDRRATAWGARAKDIAKYLGIFGEAWTISYLDKNYPYGGVATERLCRPGSVLLNPNATGKERDEGCWYAVHVDMVTGQWVKQALPKFDIKGAKSADENILKYAVSSNNVKRTDFTHTKVYDKVEVWLDDPELLTVPFSQEEFDQRAGRLAETLQGAGVSEESEEEVVAPEEGIEQESEVVQPNVDDNHPRWIKAWYDFLEERADFALKQQKRAKTTDEDEYLLEHLKELVEGQIAAHEQLAKNLEFEGAKIRKYPYGRHIIRIGGQLAMDQAHEYDCDWRKLLHKVYNEKVPLRLDGRSDVEIQRPTQQVLDMALSRFYDHMFLNAYKKPYFREAEKATIEKHGFDNDPTSPGYTQDGQPPKYGEVSEPSGYLKIVQLMKGAADKNVGISEVTFGKSNPQDSGRKVDTLLQQSEFVVTGEANSNLQAYVEEVVEARLLIMRQFYVQPRPYTVGGKQVLLNVSQMLKNVEVTDKATGELMVIEYPQFEIAVRPDSNAPNRWEREVSQLQQLLQSMPPEMQAGFAEMIVDLLSERYPDLGPNGRFRMVNQATQIGMQILENQAKQKKERDEVLKMVGNKRKRQMAEEYMARSSEGGGNGNGRPGVKALNREG